MSLFNHLPKSCRVWETELITEIFIGCVKCWFEFFEPQSTGGEELVYVIFSRNENTRVRRQIQLNILLTGMRIKFTLVLFAVQGVIYCMKSYICNLTSSWGGGCHRMLSICAAFRSDHRESSQMMFQTTSNKLSGGRERFRINSFGCLPGISPLLLFHCCWM